MSPWLETTVFDSGPLGGIGTGVGLSGGTLTGTWWCRKEEIGWRTLSRILKTGDIRDGNGEVSGRGGGVLEGALLCHQVGGEAASMRCEPVGANFRG